MDPPAVYMSGFLGLPPLIYVDDAKIIRIKSWDEPRMSLKHTSTKNPMDL